MGKLRQTSLLIRRFPYSLHLSLNVIFGHESSIIPLYWNIHLAFDLENPLAPNYLKLKVEVQPTSKWSWLYLFTFQKWMRASLKFLGISSSSCKAYMKTSLFIGNNSTIGYTRYLSNAIFSVNKFRNEHWNHIP